MVDNAGEGEIYMDKDVFKLSGTVFGKPIEFSTQSEKIGAFPVGPGKSIDIYHEGKLLGLCPEGGGARAVQWVCFLDRLMETKRQEKESA